ncbi:MAG: type II toxin-antitoxin system RelE/ParE family toxin [Vicinamibacterales bacterium]
MRPVNIAATASRELAEAVRWYETKRPGLGGEFYDAVVEAIALLQQRPGVGRQVDGPPPYRQMLVERFPYHVVYRERPADLYVVAVAHTKRRPEYWKARK